MPARLRSTGSRIARRQIADRQRDCGQAVSLPCAFSNAARAVRRPQPSTEQMAPADHAPQERRCRASRRGDRRAGCLPGTTRITATCPGACRRRDAAARRTARPLPRLAVGDHAAADDGRGGQALFPQLRRQLADGRGARRRRRPKMSCRPGPGSATIRAPATSRPAPISSPRCPAAGFPTPRRACAPCPASAPTRRRRSRRSPSTGRRRSSTAMSSGSWRGCSRSATPLPGRQAGDPRAGRDAGAAGRGPAISPRR